MLLDNTYQAPTVQSAPQNSLEPLKPLPKEKKPLGLIIGLVGCIFIIISTTVFGYWAYSQMLDYKNNSDQKSSKAVEKAKAEQKKVDEAIFAEQEKSPLKSYVSPPQFGSVTIIYPKTWSAYVIEQTSSGSTPIDGYFNTNFVPSVNAGDKVTYNLRLQITNATYKAVTDQYKTYITQGKLRATPYTAANVATLLTGIRLDGQLTQNKKGAMVIMPFRDKVLKLWTESEAGVADFDAYILAKLTFSP